MYIYIYIERDIISSDLYYIISYVVLSRQTTLVCHTHKANCMIVQAIIYLHKATHTKEDFDKYNSEKTSSTTPQQQ